MTLAFDMTGLESAHVAPAAACASKTAMMLIITPTIGTGRTRAL